MNIFLYNYYFFSLNLPIFNLLNISRISEYQDDYIVLKNPKLVELITFSLFQSQDSVPNDKSINSMSGVTNALSNKFEKKNKSISDDKNLLKAKKQKGRLMKSRRTTSENIKEVNLFVDDSNDFFISDSLVTNNIKSRKTNPKNKKKNKLKSDLSIESNSNNLLQKEHINDKKNIFISKPLTISELSNYIGIPEAEIITYLFLNKSLSVTINHLLDLDMIESIADNYGFNILRQLKTAGVVKPFSQQDLITSSKITRPPIVTILGHVDHGKTTLLDSILKTNLVDKEQGGITQNIVGYEITWIDAVQQCRIVFLDTPGHESFKSMRIRGAKVTDFVLLVIALDDGIKPQTFEVINYIHEMNLQCIVVGTKADKATSSVLKIKQDLAKHNLVTEDMGGNIPFIEVSAVNGQNIDMLLSKICSMSKAKNLCADTKQNGFGCIIESYLDKKQGPVANIVIQNGILKLGHFIASDNLIGKVKNIFSSSKSRIKSAGPSSVVQVLGFPVVPQAGSTFYSFDTEKDAKKYCKEFFSDLHLGHFSSLTKSLNTRITKDTTSDIKNLNLVIKTANQGSLEAILELFASTSQSKVQINLVHASFGDISHADLDLALATKSIIIAFNVNVSSQISRTLKKLEINFKLFSVIYDLLDYVKEMMFSLIEPEYDYILIGSATVKNIFKMNKGCVAGCFVDTGKLSKDSYIHVYRNNVMQYEGFIKSLKHMKSDVNEVLVSTECGLMLDFDSWQILDKIEAYELVKKAKTL